MAVYYGKIRLLVPSVADGKNATITSERGISRTVEMSSPITDVMLAGMEKYTVQAGTGQSTASIGFGEMQKIVTEDASAITVASMPTKTRYLVGENLDLTGVAINATIQKGDGISEIRDVTSQCDFDPANGTQLNTQGTQQIDVAWQDFTSSFNISVFIRQLLKQSPYSFQNASATILNGEIHAMGGISNGTVHRKWDGRNWIDVSTLPYGFIEGQAVVYNNEIHILGGATNSSSDAPNAKYHYKWDGTSWTSVSTLPFEFSLGQAVVYNNEIHILGSHYYTSASTYPNAKYHYKWNGTSWTSVSTLPYNFYSGAAIVYNNEIHILGTGAGNGTSHYKWDGSSWTSVSTLPYAFSGLAVVNKNEINILGGGSSSNQQKHYKWDGTNWTSVSTLPYKTSATFIALNWNSGADYEIAVLGFTSPNQKDVAQWDGSSWTLGTS